MDFTQIAQHVGCLDTAVEDVTRRLEARFQDETPSPEAVQQWVEQTLKPEAPHLFPQTPQPPWERLGVAPEVWHSLSPSTKLAMARQVAPPAPARPGRPERFAATPEQLASVEGKSAAEKLTAGRAWRDTQP